MWSSLRNRIAIVASLVTLVVLVVVSVILIVGQQRQLDAAVDGALEEEIVQVQQQLAITFGGRQGRRGTLVDDDAIRAFMQRSGNDFQLVRSNGQVVLAAGLLSETKSILEVDELFEPENDGIFQTVADQNGRRFRVVSATVGPESALIVGYSLADVDRAQAALRGSLLVAIPLLAGLLGILIWFFVGRALLPVEKLRREVDGIGVGDLDSRVSVPDTAELSALADTMNSMLSRVERSVTEQQRFVADASHELRSPLTGIRGQLEVNLQHPEAPGRTEADAEILEETIRMQALVDDLLSLARADQGHQQVRKQMVDLDDVVLAEVARQRLSTEVLIESGSVVPLQTLANESQMTRLVRNLLSNAVRHARSTVTVELALVGDLIQLAISDDGPGVPAGMRETIFERFTRSDEARDRDSGGSGLGLAISQSIAKAHAGTIRLEPPSRFVVTIPLRR